MSGANCLNALFFTCIEHTVFADTSAHTEFLPLVQSGVNKVQF